MQPEGRAEIFVYSSISAPSAGEACGIFAEPETRFGHFGKILAASDKNPAEN